MTTLIARSTLVRARAESVRTAAHVRAAAHAVVPVWDAFPKRSVACDASRMMSSLPCEG